MKTPGDTCRCSPRRLADVKPYVYPAGFDRRRVQAGYEWVKKMLVGLLARVMGRSSKL